MSDTPRPTTSSPTASPANVVTLVNVQRFSTEDGPGIRTTVFFKGCPMRCPWCHNPETLRFEPEVVWHGGRCLGDGGCVEVCTEKALTIAETGVVIDRPQCTGCGDCVDFCPGAALEIHGRTMDVGALGDFLQRDAAFYAASGGGVTLSGGEPLAQPEGAIALLELLRDAGIHTAVDTCGIVREEVLRNALDATDLVLFDVKTVDPAKHKAFTGTPFERMAASAELVGRTGTPVWVRTPIIPGYTDDDDGIRAVARFVRETFPACQRHDLLAFSNLCQSKYEQLARPWKFISTPLMTADRMQQLRDAALEEAGAAAVHWSGSTRLEDAEA